MTKLINLGLASEETKGAYLSATHVDGIMDGKRTNELGETVSSKPNAPDDSTYFVDPN